MLLHRRKFCDYGCKQLAKYQFKNGKWCCCLSKNSCMGNIKKRTDPQIGKSKGISFRKGKSFLIEYGEERAKEIKEKISKNTKQALANIEIRDKILLTSFKKGNIPWNKGTKGKMPIAWNKGKPCSEETKFKLHISNLGKSSPNKGKKLSSIYRKIMHQNAINQWKDNNYREKRSKDTRELWKNPDYVAKQMKSRGASPNKLEKYFEKYLNNLYPNEWKYVGDGQLIINGKCPDFVNINGQKKLIEVWGDYWHREQDPENRKKIFRKFGYDTLVLWEKEFKNMNKIENKLMKFSGAI